MTRGVFWILSNIYDNSYDTWKQLTLQKKKFPIKGFFSNCDQIYIYWKNP